MDPLHHFRTSLTWKGDRGSGTSAYTAYGREHVLQAAGKPDIVGSSEEVYRGDVTRWSPEDLLVGSLSACHMLWYLHLCSRDGVTVVEYTDSAEGTMRVHPDGYGRFEEVVLRPRTVIGAGDPGRAQALHEDAHRSCFIASSVNFPVRHEPTVVVAQPGRARPS